jgi:hypothetical protein
MSVSRAQQQAIEMRRIERERRRREEIEKRQTKAAHAMGLTLMQWWIRRDNLKKVAEFKEAIAIVKHDPELRAALLRELGCSCIDGQKALPAPERGTTP